MPNIAKLIRIEPAFDDPELVRAMFERHAPYRTMAGYLPIESREGTSLPWFRGNWAANGEPLVAGAEQILHNQRFIDAARTFFRGSSAYQRRINFLSRASWPLTFLNISW